MAKEKDQVEIWRARQVDGWWKSTDVTASMIQIDCVLCVRTLWDVCTNNEKKMDGRKEQR